MSQPGQYGSVGQRIVDLLADTDPSLMIAVGESTRSRVAFFMTEANAMTLLELLKSKLVETK